MSLNFDTVMVKLNIAVEIPPNTNAYQLPGRTSLRARATACIKRTWARYFQPGTPGEEGVVFLADPVVITEEQPAENANQTSSIITSVYQSMHLSAKRQIESLRRLWTRQAPGEEGVVMTGPILADPVEEHPAETANRTSSITTVYLFPVQAAKRQIESLRRLWTRRAPREEVVVMPGPVLATPLVVELDNPHEIPAETNNQRSPITNVYRFPVQAAKRSIESLRRLWNEGLMMQGSVLAAPLVVAAEEQPAETNNETSSINNVFQSPVIAASRLIASLRRLWADYFQPGTLGEEGASIPGSAFKFIILGLFSLAAIKSQGNTRFPFQSHPLTITVVITSLILYGLGYAAEYVISSSRAGPNSVYASIARLGMKLCLCTLMVSMASLFYL